MNVDKNITIYVDGHPVNTKCRMQDGQIMVPFLFFKYAGVKVGMESKEKQIILKRFNQMLKLYVNGRYAIYYPRGEDIRQKELLKVIPTDTFLPLEYIAEKLGIEYQLNDNLSRSYLITSIYSVGKPEIIYKGETEQNRIAITFEGVPGKEIACKLLNILKDKNVKATFFCLGERIKELSKVLEHIAKEGHEIGILTWSYSELPKLTTYQLVKEIKKTKKHLESIIKNKTNLFRPINGRVTDADLITLNDLGQKVIGWNINTADYLKLSDEDIEKKLSMEVSYGSIITHSNFYKDEALIEEKLDTLAKIIEKLQARDMEFVTVKQLLNI
ncbi:MAG: polysaccharide deacetylase family protein [Bacillota bacterium]|nr:polysaccharide deacetylase family protein [Bacillota bacterium]